MNQMTQTDPNRDQIFRAFADPTRRALFERLCRDGAQTVHSLTKGAAISQPAVSKHLAVLKSAGLISGQVQGRETRYSAEPKALVPLTDWLAFYTSFWETKFDGLTDLLKRMDQ